MAYTLDPTILDEMTLKGKFLSSGKKWAHVLHGKRDSIGAAVTSTQLLSRAEQGWHTVANAVDGNLSQDIQLQEIDVRQVLTYKSRFGRVTQLGLTIAGGVITAVAILDPGAGYINGGDFAIIWDNAGTGTGAIISLTYTGNVCTAAAVVAGGVGYSNLTYATAPLPDLTAGNRYDYVYGAADFLAGLTDNGSLVTDREPSFNSVSVRMRSAFAGRAGRGAAHWPGIVEAQTTGDIINVGDLTLLQAAATQWFITPWGGGLPTNWVRVILSPTRMHLIPPSANPTTAQYSSPISTAIVNTNVGSMLRRKLRN